MIVAPSSIATSKSGGLGVGRGGGNRHQADGSQVAPARARRQQLGECVRVDAAFLCFAAHVHLQQHIEHASRLARAPVELLGEP
jgi:hypothetical protein